MAYNKTVWTETTAINVTNLNNIEDELEYLDNDRLSGETGHKHNGQDGEGAFPDPRFTLPLSNSPSTPPSSYPAGFSYSTVLASNGWPYDGIVVTISIGGSTITQELISKASINLLAEDESKIKKLTRRNHPDTTEYPDTWTGWTDVIGWNEETVESGSNANGYYIRYPDGRQECYVLDFLIKPSSDDTPGNKQVTWTFPAAFIDDKYVAGHAIITSNPQARGSVGVLGHLTDSVNLNHYEANGVSIDTKTRAWAIGRWK